MKVDLEKEVEIPAEGVRLRGILGQPEDAGGVVLFAHGSGSGRLSPRNRYVAERLMAAGFATLLIDLLEEGEALDRKKVFDIDLLSDRLLAAAEWLAENESTRQMRIGYFGASTGAAAALQAAARVPEKAAAIVSRGGRPDLAMDYLEDVRAPTLLIVGSEDYPVIPLNREAYSRLNCVKKMVIVPGAGHLFEEPGKLEEVARLAEEWFTRHLSS